MTDNVVGLNGQPVEPEVPYDGGLIDILDRAIADVKSGRATGVAVILTGPDPSGFAVDCSYQGPRLVLISGCARMAHKLNMDFDKAKEKIIST